MRSDVSITVVDDEGWGDASPSDIRIVCQAVADCFTPAVLEAPVEPIRVEPSTLVPARPRTVFERLPTGEIRVMLSVYERLWAKCAFQFAHEFLHVLANIPSREPAGIPSYWLEESLADAASHFALRSMARSWPQSSTYRPEHFRRYSDTELSEPDCVLPAGEAFSTWLPKHLPAMEADCYRREDCTIVGRQLLPIFEGDRGTWRAIRYLNRDWPPDATASLGAYFAAWRSRAPDSSHDAISRIESALNG